MGVHQHNTKVLKQLYNSFSVSTNFNRGYPVFILASIEVLPRNVLNYTIGCKVLSTTYEAVEYRSTNPVYSVYLKASQ